MRWEDIDQQVCSVARAMAVVGDRWTLLIVRDAMLGTRRFEDFRRQLGINRHRLTERLNKLVAEGVMTKIPYQQRPERFEYTLTEKGLDLYPVVLMLSAWGNRWCSDDKGVPVEYLHRTCNKKTEPQVCCSECGEPLEPHDVTPLAGPALKEAISLGHEVHLPPLLQKSLG